jgi:hypothetical protein
MTKPILVTRDFGCCTTMCNQIMVTKIDFLSVFCEKIGFQWKELGKFKNFLGFECKFNQISYILAKFCKRINTKKMKRLTFV